MQQGSGEALTLDTAGGALDGDGGLVLGPGRRIGHRQAGQAGQTTGESEFRHRDGGRTGGCEETAPG
ncbi:hypothetical protein ACSCB1_36160 [Streptomyces europaeiscabiei]|uniref:hypothetical protein n=1 Tax=Streptomyces europaeiscabiei TaxID=146819 RepID=UPI000765DA5F|nr:hypothetical protein [Streptomyces europaeiscabiei]